jgi:hypothetical protein
MEAGQVHLRNSGGLFSSQIIMALPMGGTQCCGYVEAHTIFNIVLFKHEH